MRLGKCALVWMILAAMCLCAGCQNGDKLAAEMREKGRLTYEDILTLAKARDMALEPVTAEDFAQKWPLAVSYVTDSGDILLLSDYDKDLFFRDRQAQALDWSDLTGFSRWKPAIVKDAIATFGHGGSEADYIYRVYAAKNILAYFITDAPVASENELSSQLLEADVENLQAINQIFLHDINDLTALTLAGKMAHGKIKIDFEGYQTPVNHSQNNGDIVLYDKCWAAMLTLDFDEDFLAKHQGEDAALILTVKEPYDGETYLHMSGNVESGSFWIGPQQAIVNAKQKWVGFEVSIGISTEPYEETVVLTLD